MRNPRAASGVKITWTKVTGAAGYYVFRKTGSGSYTTIKTVKSGDTVTFTDTAAVAGTTYTYGVRAYTGSTKGAYTAKSIKRTA